jgi:hypothetical protein
MLIIVAISDANVMIIEVIIITTNPFLHLSACGKQIALYKHYKYI